MFISSAIIRYSSLFIETFSPVWLNLLTPNLIILLTSRNGLMKVKTKNYNYSNVAGIVGNIYSFTGIKIRSYVFGALFIGYAKKVEASGFFAV